ncbi:reducing type I polyketide synthase [Aspergillus ustus]|uniref:Reducing type I polyketide synthase n=1 Tax=Aspergillus ustus TaxID=40382 RepID=A0A0C1EFP5_ASPUT|nr:reducing type I polyketide synthase [Aspergillus ustus]
MAPMMLSGDDSESSQSSNASVFDAPSRRPSEPIAICGMGILLPSVPLSLSPRSCRLPGQSSTPQKFWDLLASGSSGQCPIPKSRFNVDSFYNESGMDRPGSVVTKGGYFLDGDIREFENSFFGINNLEATHMDPQQRKLLEVVFECLENAGVPLEQASGSNTGCYVGNFTFDFMVMQTRDADYMGRYSATGLGTTILANRISHVFNLQGPSLVLDTACSSSLYCLHVACMALEAHECDAAIVAGANLIQSVEQHIATMKAGVLSATSACHTFDTSADGYGRADGIGALYVKRLSDAIRDGDPIRSVVRGSAVNANGKTTGISLPSADGQEMVIRRAMARGAVSPEDITYIECHGTGTKVGDAIEVDALSRVFKRTPENPLLIGSVKSNVGHSEAASGISSIIKSTMALENGRIPGTYGLVNVNPKLKVEERNFSIPTSLTAWPERTLGNRRIGINSFGYGGANVHVILEEAPRITHKAWTAEDGLASAVVLPLSAATESSLQARLDDLATFDFSDTNLLDLAHTLGARRSQLPVRGFLIAPSQQSITESLATQPFIKGSGLSNPTSDPFAFVFTGQGSQWPGMCKELFATFGVFRKVIIEMDLALMSLPHAPDWSLKEAILNTDSPDLIHLPQRSQPCCTAIQIGLIQLLASWNIHPSVTVGHSSGEIAAAFAAGHLSASEAIVIAYYRGYCVSTSVRNGAMMALGLSEEAAVAEIAERQLSQNLTVACVNSPEGVTVSGDTEQLDCLLSELSSKGTFARKLKTGGQAYHSHHMLAIGEEYERLLRDVLPTLDPSTRLPEGASVISSVTGELKSTDFGPAYWRRNLENQVRFTHAIAKIHEIGKHCFIELGPHSSLELPIKQTLARVGVASSEVQYVAPIKRNANSLHSALTLPGNLWLKGYNIAWAQVNGLQSGSNSKTPAGFQVVRDLPRYRFHYDTTLWTESRASLEYRSRKYPRHELLGTLVPGGNGTELIFRNLLRVDDVHWLKDHRLGEDIVFPGAGYLAMAMEAIMRATDAVRTPEGPSFRFSNVNITAPLVLPEDSNSQTEIFTTLTQSPITKCSTSKIWWDFRISSFGEQTSVSHATGSIAITPKPAVLEPKYKRSSEPLEPSAKRIWYERFIKQGLNYGDSFQVFSKFHTPSMKTACICSGEAPLLTVSGDPTSVYPIHPITLDGMIQLAIAATTSGRPKELRGYVPTRLRSIQLNTVTSPSGEPCFMHAQSRKTGFGSAEADVEIISQTSQVVARFEDLRLNAIEPENQGEDTRHPALRVLWKPDVRGLGFMTTESAEAHLQQFADEAVSPVSDDGLLKMGAMLDLLVHKDPTLRILELNNEGHELTAAVLEMLAYQSDFKRLKTYTTASIDDEGVVAGGPVSFETGTRSPPGAISSKFNLILVPGAGPWIERNLDKLLSLLEDGGSVLALCDNVASTALSSSTLDCLSCPVSNGQATLILGSHERTPHSEALQKGNFVVVETEETPLGTALMHALTSFQTQSVTRVNLHELTASHIPKGATIFSLCEIHSPLLSVTSDAEMGQIKLMTDHAASLVWITNGNTMHGDRPDFALVSGVARALALEQPSLKFYTYDIDTPDIQVETTTDRLLAVLHQSFWNPDLEFVQRKGVVHISRFIPDDGFNAEFRNKQGLEPSPMKLGDAGEIELTLGVPGQFDSIFFHQFEPIESIGANQVRIKVASVGLNAKDYYVLAGRVDTPDATCQLECAGTVVQVGDAVRQFSVGDRVVAMAPTQFRSYQTLPEWACHKLLESDDMDVCATIPLVYSTALYALHYRANLQAGETVLIHSGAGGVGIAAIQLAIQAGAEVFTTVSTLSKKKYLIETLGVKPDHIFSSLDTSFLPAIQAATANRGVDVILNSLTGDQLHATWACCAPYGRFVEIGKVDLSNSGRLEMTQFLKDSTFTAFDLSHLYHSTDERCHVLWRRLLSQVMTLYRRGEIPGAQPLKVFDISEAEQAFRFFANRGRMGKIAISLKDSTSEIKVQRCKYASRFDSQKSYIMVGCLGGLGRTLARWMLGRGAKRFVFLGRSGLDKPVARRLVEDLEAAGAECAVVRGDVCSADDVQAVVTAAAAQGPVGGVVQAAMGLNEAIFSVMSNDYWHTGIDPKVHGTWHLYNKLHAGGHESTLDFFLMTSSVSGSVGTATEANYCSGNHFLDLFARHLRAKGLPAVALGLGMISEVGYLHENPEIEAILLRKGIQAIDADELLQLVDIALSTNKKVGIHHAHDSLAVSHILTGLEAFGLKELRKKGFEGSYPALDDPRANLLASALEIGGLSSSTGSRDGKLPAEVVKATEAGDSLDQAVLDHIRRRFGNLVLMKYEAVDVDKPLASYGMDSMIGAEFRSWFYQSLKLDVALVTLLGNTCTLRSLGERAVKGLEE